MIIKEGNAQDIYNWFVTGQSGYDILCIFLCKDSEQVDSLTQLINSSFSVDAIIRENVGFLFIFDGVKEALGVRGKLGEVNVLPGHFGFHQDRQRSTRVGEFLEAYDRETLRNKKDFITEKIGNIIAKKTAHTVPDFCNFFNIDYSDLPGMLTFYKGYEEVQYYKFSHYSAEDIKNFFIAIVDIQKKIESQLLNKRLFSFEVKGKLVTYRQLLIEIEGKKNKIKKCIIGMCERHRINREDCENILSVLSNNYLNSEQRIKSCEQFEEKYPVAKKDGRLLKALKISQRLREVWNDGKNLVSPNELRDLSDQIEVEKTKIDLVRAELKEFLNNYAGEKTSPEYGSKPSLWKKVETGNTSWDAVDKLGKLVKFILEKLATSGV